MTSRDAVLAAVRANQPASRRLHAMPVFDRDTGPLVEQFREGLVRMGGKLAPPGDERDLDALVKSLFPDAKVICSATPEAPRTRPLDKSATPASLADVDVAVVRGAFGVAETGSVWLSEEELKVNALAYLAQHLRDPRAMPCW